VIRSDHAATIKSALVNVAHVCHELGLTPDAQSFRRQPAGLLVRCPSPNHQDRTPSCSIQERGGVLVWKCHGCDAGGDVLELVAAVRGLSTKRDFRAVLLEAARLANLWSIVEEIEGRVDARENQRETPPPKRAPTPDPAPRPYPPGDEVADLWSGAVPISREKRVAEYLAGRSIAPEAVEDLDLARALPEGLRVPWWAGYKGAAAVASTWIELGYRLIVPMFDAEGTMRSVRAWRVVDGEGPKRLPPSGHGAKGLVMADATARTLLELGKWSPGMDGRVVIVEGEPDFLTWATRFSDGAETVPAILGILSGAWTPELAARIPDGARVVVRTHGDQAGDKYAATIGATLAERCTLRRASGG
jgi:hypothetical protein